VGKAVGALQHSFPPLVAPVGLHAAESSQNLSLIGPFKGINRDNTGFVFYVLYKMSGSKTKVFGFFPRSWRV